MRKVLLLGAGKIGRMIARFLAQSCDYEILVGDGDPGAFDRLGDHANLSTRHLNADDPRQLADALAGRDLVISALSFAHNPLVAQTALAAGASYFDLTEDIQTTQRVGQIAAEARPGQVFMPQCGLAPGFVSILAYDLAHHFDELDTLFMRVGALPQFPSNALMYNLTWSTDGLINEYCNECEAIHERRLIKALPLEGVEHFSLDGVRYEAFNTSGGLGTLCETLAGQVRELNYKTIRYVGHRDLMRFLTQDLRLADRRDVLKDILENAVPVTFQDVVVVFCTAQGKRKGQLVQISDARKVYGETIDGEAWSAIQITTAAGICAVVDLFCQGRLAGTGLVRQEEVKLADFLANRFGRYYRGSKIFSRFAGALEGNGAGHEEDAG